MSTGHAARQGLATAWERLAAAGFELWVLTLVLLTLNEAYRGLAVDLVERRRRVRILFVVGVSAFLAATVVVQVYNLVQATETPGLLVTANSGLDHDCGTRCNPGTCCSFAPPAGSSRNPPSRGPAS